VVPVDDGVKNWNSMLVRKKYYRGIVFFEIQLFNKLPQFTSTMCRIDISVVGSKLSGDMMIR